MQPQQIVDEVVKSNLRGRGRRRLPHGHEVELRAQGDELSKYLVVNADEGERGRSRTARSCCAARTCSSKA